MYVGSKFSTLHAHAQEAIEDYSLTSSLRRGNKTIYTEKLEGTIEEGYSHSREFQVTSESMTIGETTVIELEPEPEPEQERRGIPGFPIASIISGILTGTIILGLRKVKRLRARGEVFHYLGLPA